LAPLNFFLSLSKTNLDEAFESRRVIEVEIVHKAAIQGEHSALRGNGPPLIIGVSPPRL
jgi:hypothetical protein